MSGVALLQDDGRPRNLKDKDKHAIEAKTHFHGKQEVNAVTGRSWVRRPPMLMASWLSAFILQRLGSMPSWKAPCAHRHAAGLMLPHIRCSALLFSKAMYRMHRLCALLSTVLGPRRQP